jgi:hypothetical protein
MAGTSAGPLSEPGLPAFLAPCQVAVVAAVQEINGEADHEPNDKPQPGFARQAELKRTAEAAPSGATANTAGVLNGRAISGRVIRKTRTPRQTTANANKVPMLTSSPTRPIGKRPARIATIAPARPDADSRCASAEGHRNQGTKDQRTPLASYIRLRRARCAAKWNPLIDNESLNIKELEQVQVDKL